MRIDDAFLAELAAAADGAEASARREVSDEEVRAKALDMARRGYRFSPESVALVRPLLEGEGLLLSGPVGTGKSFFCRAAGVAALNLKVAQGRTLDQIARALDDHEDVAVVVDDVGAEEQGYQSFGTRVRLLDYVLERRADSPAPTHFTTNLSADERLARYGERIDDRLFGFAREFRLEGESRRGPSGPRPQGAWFADFFRGRLWPLCARRCPFYDADERRCTKGKSVEPGSYKATGYDEQPRCPHFP